MINVNKGGVMLGWFKALSLISKTGLITGASIVAVGTAGAVTHEPVITIKKESKTVPISFEENFEKNNELLKSESKIKIPGVDGSQIITYKVTFSDGKEIKREAIKQQIIKEPITQTSFIGTREILIEQSTQTIPCITKYVQDSSLSPGTSVTRTECKGGVVAITHEVIKVEGNEISRKVVKEEVTSPPVDKVIAQGPKVQSFTSNCTPGYSPCIAPGSDVDCAGGSGNGPRYTGPVRVTGPDPYDLDRDGDGYGCE